MLIALFMYFSPITQINACSEIQSLSEALEYTKVLMDFEEKSKNN